MTCHLCGRSIREDDLDTSFLPGGEAHNSCVDKAKAPKPNVVPFDHFGDKRIAAALEVFGAAASSEPTKPFKPHPIFSDPCLKGAFVIDLDKPVLLRAFNDQGEAVYQVPVSKFPPRPIAKP